MHRLEPGRSPARRPRVCPASTLPARAQRSPTPRASPHPQARASPHFTSSILQQGSGAGAGGQGPGPGPPPSRSPGSEQSAQQPRSGCSVTRGGGWRRAAAARIARAAGDVGARAGERVRRGGAPEALPPPVHLALALRPRPRPQGKSPAPAPQLLSSGHPLAAPSRPPKLRPHPQSDHEGPGLLAGRAGDPSTSFLAGPPTVQNAPPLGSLP